jgi:hypothetical protein
MTYVFRDGGYGINYLIGRNPERKWVVHDPFSLIIIGGLIVPATLAIVLGTLVSPWFGLFAIITVMAFMLGLAGLMEQELETPFKRIDVYEDTLEFGHKQANKYQFVYDLIKSLYSHPDIDSVTDKDALVAETVEHIRRYNDDDSGYTLDNLHEYGAVLKEIKQKCDTLKQQRIAINAGSMPGMTVAESAREVADQMIIKEL